MNRTRLLILLLLPALAAHSFAGETNLVGATTARVGRSLFLKNCAQCHGDDARGDEEGPDLHGLKGSDEWIEYRIRNGVKGEMPAFREKYSQSDIDALITFLRSLISPDRRARGDGVTEHDGYSSTTTDLTQQSGNLASPNRLDAARHAPAAGLRYDVRIGTRPGGVDILSPEADPATGWRCVTTLGNLGGNLLATFHLSSGNYYWSVQAVDTSFAGTKISLLYPK